MWNENVHVNKFLSHKYQCCTASILFKRHRCDIPKKPAPHCCFVICDFGSTSWNTLCWCSFSFWMAARMKSDSSKMHSINIINGNILNSLRLFIFNLAFFICNGKNLEKIKNLKILINQQRSKQHSIRDIAFQVVAILVLLYSMREKKKPATR